MSASRSNCPTCGQPVSVHISGEGTSSYVGEAENALRELLRWQPTYLHPQRRAAILKAREVVGDDIPF